MKVTVKKYMKCLCMMSNKEGLLSLADHLFFLAEGTFGSQVHYDEYNSLEEGSAELIIERIP